MNLIALALITMSFTNPTTTQPLYNPYAGRLSACQLSEPFSDFLNCLLPLTIPQSILAPFDLHRKLTHLSSHH